MLRESSAGKLGLRHSGVQNDAGPLIKWPEGPNQLLGAMSRYGHLKNWTSVLQD